MDFFEHQEAARKKTGRLVLLFVLAVVVIIVLVYGVVAGVLLFNSAKTGSRPPSLWQPEILLLVGLGTITIVLAGSFYKTSQLRGGGHVIAETLGGRLIDTGSRDLLERKVLNVVEEMALASGTPVPPVYLLEKEAGINAFAAGHSPDDAVIGVTKGTIELLSRDELQGVMAHEFSHILNGDMRMNIRLIGVIHGILVIGLLGGVMLRSAFYSGAARGRRSSSKEGGGGAIAILAIGLGLLVVGYAGVFFGQLIKAAVSRQREFLADASAVQFTRLPGGISGALKKISGYVFQSKINSPHAEQASHMFFGEGVSHVLGAVMATHPPLATRITRIEPDWDGAIPKVEPSQRVVEKARRKAHHLSRQPAAVAGLAAAAIAPVPLTGAGRIGQPTSDHIEYAAQLVAALPDTIKEAAHEAFGARALVYALLLDEQPEPRRRQIERLEQHADPQVKRETHRLAPLVARLDLNARLPLIDMALASLRELSADQYRAFRNNVEELIRADERIDLFEWVLRRIIVHHLEPPFTRVRPRRTRYYSLRPLSGHCALLLSTLAYAGHAKHDEARHAFAAGAAHLEVPALDIQPVKSCNLKSLDEALDALAEVGPREKRKVLAACAACISADRTVTVKEGELLRAVADSLDCPMTPLLPGQPLW